MRDPRSEVSLAEALSRCLERLESEPDLAPEKYARDYPEHVEELRALIAVAIQLRTDTGGKRVRRRVADLMSSKSGDPLASIIGDRTKENS